MRVLSFDVGVKNLAACCLEVDASGQFQILDWDVYNVVQEGTNVNKTSLEILAPQFYDFCHSKLEAWLGCEPGQSCARVFIETQPMGGRGGARNLKTKVMSHMLQCQIRSYRPDVPVSFVHPSLKLKDMPRLEPKSSYRANKLYAIQKTEEYLNGTDNISGPEITQKFAKAKAKKRDDLADSFLQGLIAALMYERGQIVEPTEPKETKVKKPAAKKRKVAVSENVDEKKAEESKPAESKAVSKPKKSAETVTKNKDAASEEPAKKRAKKNGTQEPAKKLEEPAKDEPAKDAKSVEPAKKRSVKKSKVSTVDLSEPVCA